MIDKKNVVNNLEAIWVCCKNRQSIKAYDEIERDMYADWADIVNDAITLPKQQEQKWVCPKCNGRPKGVVCGICGQAVSLYD